MFRGTSQSSNTTPLTSIEYVETVQWTDRFIENAADFDLSSFKRTIEQIINDTLTLDKLQTLLSSSDKEKSTSHSSNHNE
jgi:hypothetical protein